MEKPYKKVSFIIVSKFKADWHLIVFFSIAIISLTTVTSHFLGNIRVGELVYIWIGVFLSICFSFSKSEIKYSAWPVMLMNWWYTYKSYIEFPDPFGALIGPVLHWFGVILIIGVGLIVADYRSDV